MVFKTQNQLHKLGRYIIQIAPKSHPRGNTSVGRLFYVEAVEFDPRSYGKKTRRIWESFQPSFQVNHFCGQISDSSGKHRMNEVALMIFQWIEKTPELKGIHVPVPKITRLGKGL